MSGLVRSPLDLLLPYQRDWVADESRFKIWNASRQIGKSFAAAAEVVTHCVEHPGEFWIILSAGERQALEMMEKVKQWLKAWDAVVAWEGIDRDGVTQEVKSAEARLANGSRIIALPANPDTARGYSGNLILDEFAFHRDPAAIWRAIYPTISNPLKGELKCRILSTPNGQGGRGAKFYEIWSDNSGRWSHHKTTIHDAKGNGLPIDIEALRAASGDADGWRQEYECEFIDSSRVAFPYDLIAGCEDERASLTPRPPLEERPETAGRLYCGIDVGTVNDPTVCLTLEERGGRYFVVEVLKVQGAALSDQDAFLAPRIQRATRASIDASGIGRDIAQRMERRFGGKVISQVTTAKWKREIFQDLQAAMSDKVLALPPDRGFRDDLHAYEVTGAGESAHYRAPRTDEGHSDITSALAHAYDAAHQDGGFFMPGSTERGRDRVLNPRRVEQLQRHHRNLESAIY